MGKILSFPSQDEQHCLAHRPSNLFSNKVLNSLSCLLSASEAISKLSKPIKKEEFVKPHYYFKLLEPLRQIEHITNTLYRRLDDSPHIPAHIRSSRYSLLVLLHTVELQAKELVLLLIEVHIHALQYNAPSLQDLRSRQDILDQIDLLVRGSRTISRQITELVQQLNAQEEQLMHS